VREIFRIPVQSEGLEHDIAASRKYVAFWKREQTEGFRFWRTFAFDDMNE
jgi:hypothetical protein